MRRIGYLGQAHTIIFRKNGIETAFNKPEHFKQTNAQMHFSQSVFESTRIIISRGVVILLRTHAISLCAKDPGKKAVSARGNRVVSKSLGYGW